MVSVHDEHEALVSQTLRQRSVCVVNGGGVQGGGEWGVEEASGKFCCEDIHDCAVNMLHQRVVVGCVCEKS